MSLSGGLIAALILLFSQSFAFAQGEPWNTPYDRFFAKPEQNAEYKTLDDGTEIRSVTLPGGVELRMERKDEKISIQTTDLSGRGAVLCIREIYLLVKLTLDACEDLADEHTSNLLAGALDNIDRFIEKNSIEPVSKQQLRAYDQAKLRETYKEMGAESSAGRVKSCKTANPRSAEFATRFANAIRKAPDEEFIAGIDEMLSVPRLPAMNPCL